MKGIKRGMIYSLFLIVGLLILILVGGVLFSNYAEERVTAKIIEHKGTIASVQINLLTRSMHLEDLEWFAPVDSANVYPYRVIIKNVHVRGIHILALLLHKKLVVNKLMFDDGIVDLNTRLAKNLPKNSTPDSTNISFKAITFTRIDIRIQDSTATYTGVLDCELTKASMQSDSAVHFSVKAAEAKLREVRVEYKGGMYSGAIKEVYMNSRTERLIIDSVLLIPMYGRDDFAAVSGNQVARVNLSIPKVTIDGLQFKELLNRSFAAAKIDIQSFDLYSYKDKRIPFVSKENRLMPMESFRKLSFRIKVDSIIIGSSHIAIEEFPDGSTTSGTMTFDDVKATFGGLNNRLPRDSSAYAVLKTSGLLMNNGLIHATFQFPLDGSAMYTARGSISNMDLITLNPVLENMVDLRIKTGHLSSLTFNFNYTDFTSKGVLNIAYQNLQIMGLDKNESTINEFKTFLIQVFTKRDKVKAEPTSNRVGIIDIERDRKRFIFNVWWKSLVDGLKSSMGGNQKRNREKKKTAAKAAVLLQ